MIDPQAVRAVWRWVSSDMGTVELHAKDELAGAPEPSSASGRKLRAEARALLQDLKENGQPVPALYRGAEVDPASESTRVFQSWSSNVTTAVTFAQKHWKSGKLYRLRKGTAIGLPISRYLSSEDSLEEQEWIVLTSSIRSGAVQQLKLPSSWLEAAPSLVQGWIDPNGQFHAAPQGHAGWVADSEAHDSDDDDWVDRKIQAMFDDGWIRQVSRDQYECYALFEQSVVDYVRRKYPQVRAIEIDLRDWRGRIKSVVVQLESTKAIAKRLFLEGQ